jgi:predicted tellurium resistance membrane protein TerC
MSLDNVLAVAAAAHGDLILVLFGVSLSIPIVIWGSGLLALLMGRYSWIVSVGAAILGWVAGEMLVKDPIVHGWIEPWVFALRWVVPAILAVAVLGVGHFVAARPAAAARGRK